MRVPIRRAEKNNQVKIDWHLTESKYLELKNKLEKLKNKRPELSAEVQRLALMGDFSENAGYQLAKGRLRGLNQRILDTENLLKNAEIIRPNSNNRVELGHRVTISLNEKTKTYQILGSCETDPSAGIISHNSPLGEALIGRQKEEIFIVKLGKKTYQCQILKIE